MTLANQISEIFILVVIVLCILFLIFRQVTVQKLRKEPLIKESLDSVLESGWAIFNVAQAFSLPRSFSKKIEKMRLSFLEDDIDLLIAHTNIYDRFLGRLFYWLFICANFSLLLVVLLKDFGVLDSSS